MPDLRRLDEEVDELMGSDVQTTRGTSACTSEKKLVREAAAAAALYVKPLTAEVRRVTLKRISVSLESRGNKELSHLYLSNTISLSLYLLMYLSYSISLSHALPSLTHHYPLSSITPLSCLSTFLISLAPLTSLAFISLLASLSTYLSFLSYYTSLFSLLSQLSPLSHFSHTKII